MEAVDAVPAEAGRAPETADRGSVPTLHEASAVNADCFDCQQALLGPWRSYSGRCPECVVRQIANTNSASREPIYERIESECGRGAMERVKELVGNEIVRQRLLRDGAST
jgi:hypothetical protein